MNKFIKAVFGISIILLLVLFLQYILIFGSLIFLGIAESVQDSMDWEYYGDDVKSDYMYNLELYVSSTPGVRTTIDNVIIYIPVVSGKDNLLVSESFIADVKQGNVYTGKWDCYFVETPNGTMIAVENVEPIMVSEKRNIVLDTYYGTDYIIDTLEPIENALILPINSDNSSKSFSNIYVKYDISEEDAKVNLVVSVHGTNSWYNSRRQDSYSQHCHLTLIGSQDSWFKADNIMFAGEGRYPEIREIKSSES
ncbi:hypothetical protein [Methanolobus sp.]|uniref:hypothetical protein n=1 Tax=Methanolobus sp. TaxID=1874737 RepID=UPI0025F89485|nr:hypothetical protein [Methanolobus sp.]